MNKVSSTASVSGSSYFGGNLSIENRKVDTSVGAKLHFSKGQGFLAHDPSDP
jgi:hypothetical protein